jgi:hypothetical protein
LLFNVAYNIERFYFRGSFKMVKHRAAMLEERTLVDRGAARDHERKEYAGDGRVNSGLQHGYPQHSAN